MEARAGHILRKRSYVPVGCICNFCIDLTQQWARSNSKEEGVVLLTLEEVQSVLVVLEKTDCKAGSRKQRGSRTQLENSRPVPSNICNNTY